MIENPIGRKVNLLVKKGVCSWEMSNETCTIIGVLPCSQKIDDWCNHYIIKEPNGEEREIREVDCVFSPDYTKQYIENTIQHFLDDNGVYAEVYKMNEVAICVSISWGDWKHSHLWARDLMSYLGYTEIGNKITEEDGSDCYSAEHYYYKMEG